MLPCAKVTVTHRHDLSKEFFPIHLDGPQTIFQRDAL
jgi:hypothetical protein